MLEGHTVLETINYPLKFLLSNKDNLVISQADWGWNKQAPGNMLFAEASAIASASTSSLLVPSAPLAPELFDVTNTSMMVSWTPPMANGGPVDGYQLRYRAVSDNAYTWNIIGDNSGESGDGSSVMLGRKAAAVHEVQKIVTRCDPGESPSDGTFELTLNFNSITDLDMETTAITNFIPFNASASQMQQALEHLDNVNRVSVSRGYDSTNGHVDDVDPESGGYTWLVTFYYDDAMLLNLPSADIPLLGVHKTSISCNWSGEGSAVATHEVQKGTLEYSFCTDDCVYNVTDLSPSTGYIFNVLARNEFGWSDSSADTDPVYTLASRPPARPLAPRLTSATSSSLHLRISAEEEQLNGDFQSYQVQFRETMIDGTTDNNSSSGISINNWVDCDEFSCAYGPASTSATGSSVSSTSSSSRNIELVGGIYHSDFVILDLISATEYEIRVRLFNDIGASPWSGISTSFSTVAGGPDAPAAPQIIDVQGTTITLSWAAPEMHGSVVLDYTVQHRMVNSVQEQLWISDAKTDVS